MHGLQTGPEVDGTDPISGTPIKSNKRGSEECLAWSYGRVNTELRDVGHSFAYLQRGQLLDYSAADGKYRLWRLASPSRPGCPGILWPPVAKGTLAVRHHTLSALPPAELGSFSLMDYDPVLGLYRLGVCNRSQTVSHGELACRTAVSGTWHSGGLQLLWVGASTLMRYVRATGDYSLWRFQPTVLASGLRDTLLRSGPPFDMVPASEGILLQADGKRLRHAVLTYLERGVVLASVPSTGYLAVYHRAQATVETEEHEVFFHRWHSSTVVRGWHYEHTGGDAVIMLNPTTGAYRSLNCSTLYSDAPPSDATTAATTSPGLPCTLMLQGLLPENAPCAYAKDQCLMAPHCGWCVSSGQCMPTNEDGVCSGSCANGQLLYGSTLADSERHDAVDTAASCADLTSCDHCTELPTCGWCGGLGGSCVAVTDAAALSKCGSGGVVQNDVSACPAEADPIVGLVDQLKNLNPVMALKRR